MDSRMDNRNRRKGFLRYRIYKDCRNVENTGGLHCMTSSELKEIFTNLTIWQKNGQRAPHKPLLILYALAQLQRGETVLPYIQVREKLKRLLIEFGPVRKSYHPEEPFVRLS